MNKKLLCLGVALLAGVSAFAQSWNRPVPEDYKFADEMKSSLQANGDYWEGDTTIYYLYNVDGRGFLTNNTCPGHAQWATHAAIKHEEGKAIMMAQYRLNPIITNDTITEGDSTIIKENVDIIPWDEVSYKLLDLHEGSWRGVFPTSPFAMFVDRGDQPDYLWNVKAQGNGVYRICVSDLNPNYNSHLADSVFGDPETYLAFDNCDADYDASLPNPVMPLIPMASVKKLVWVNGEALEAEPCFDWKFMPEDQYLLYRNHVKAWDYIHNTLDAFVEETALRYPTIDLSALKAFKDSTEPVLYSDIEPVLTEIAHAKRVADIEIMVEGADNDNPAELTTLMTNPDFNTGNTNGWTLTYVKGVTGTNLGYQQNQAYTNGETRIEKFFEAWSNANYGNDPAGKRTLGNGKGYQVVKDLPAGKYKFTCDAIASRQDEGNQGLEKGAYLYAKSGEFVFRQMIGTNNGVPEHFEIIFINPTASDFELGFMTENTTINWLAVDNFTLWYYGEVSENPYQAVLESTIAELEKKYADPEELKANKDIKANYLAALEAAKNCEDDFQAADSVLQAAGAEFGKSITQYERMLLYLSEVGEKMDAFEYSDFPGLGEELGQYYMDLEEAFDEEEVGASYIDSIPDVMGKIIVDYITANVKPGDELTPLIKNPDFNENFSGWSTTGARPGFGGKGANGANAIGDTEKLESGNAEVFHATFDMFQLIKNMPKGSFKLTCQAFERNDAEGKKEYDPANPEANINAVLYANEYTAKVSHIRAFASESAVYETFGSDGARVWTSDATVANLFGEGKDGFIPNSMDGANFYFDLSPETYMCEVNFTLKESGDSITIGLKNTYNNSWVIFDNFRLFYNGEGVEAYKESIEKLTASLEAIKATESKIGTPAIAAVDSALADLDAAVNGDSGDACIAAIDRGTAALEGAKESIRLYTELTNSYNQLCEDLETYAESASANAIASANALATTTESAIDNCNLTNAEVTATIDEIAAAIENLKLRDVGSLLPSNMASASEANPIELDILINPNYEDAEDVAWTWPVKGDNLADMNKCGGTDDYKACEFYAGWGSIQGQYLFEHYQAVAGLPNGYYKIGVYGFNRSTEYGEITDANEDGKVDIYANEVSQRIASIKDGSASVPNSMAEAANAFKDGRYYNEIIVEVTDGILKVGVHKTEATTLYRAWTLISHWTVSYLGADTPTAIESVEKDNIAGGVYNLAGQKLAAPAKGINIINGKKFIVK